MNRFSVYMGAAVMVAGLALAGCGGEGEKSTGGTNEGGNGESSSTSDKGTTKTAFPTDTATVAVTGIVKFEGETPERKALPISGSDEFCANHNKANPIFSEKLVVNEHEGFKTLSNVYVRVKGIEKQWTFAVPTEQVVVKQDGCQYRPHAAAIMIGQELRVTHVDATDHNVHFESKKNLSWNKTTVKGDDVVKTFGKADLKAKLKCDIHTWMGARLFINKHPYHAVTGEDGTFNLGMLPPGTYEIEVRHESFDKQLQTVTLEEGKPAEITFTFSQG